MSESVRAELQALGDPLGVCLLRRSGSLLQPAPLLPGGEPPSREPLEWPRGLGGERPALVLDGATGLESFRALTGPGARLAILCPVPPPSPAGTHDLYLLAWFRQEPSGHDRQD